MKPILILIVVAALGGCQTTTQPAKDVLLDRLCKAYPDSALCERTSPP